MRILLVNAQGADLAAGGSGRYVADLARGLAARGHGMHVLAAFPVADDGAESTTVLHERHWQESNLRRIQNHVGDVAARPAPRLRDAVASARPDVVHTSNLPGFSTAIWEVSRRLGVPVVHTLHDYHLLCPRCSLTRRDGSPCCPHSRFCRFRTRRLMRWAGAVSIVVCGSEHLWKREGHLFPGTRVELVRVPSVPVSSRSLTPPSTPPQAVGYLGGLDPIKGVSELLESAPALAELGLRVRLAGAGRLQETVASHAAAGRVEYVGPVSGAAREAFIEATDIAVVPSTWEEANGPPYVVAEWLAAGRPVLASTRGGLVEARHLPGVTAIEPTAEGIVSGARMLVGAAWEQISSALTPVTDFDDMERWLDQHLSVYEEAAAARRASTSS